MTLHSTQIIIRMNMSGFIELIRLFFLFCCFLMQYSFIELNIRKDVRTENMLFFTCSQTRGKCLGTEHRLKSFLEFVSASTRAPGG